MKNIDVNSKETQQLVNILKLLAHPIRFSIAVILQKNGTMNVGTIQQTLDLPQSSVSQHISKMREAGLVETRREGTKIFYSLQNEVAKKLVKNFL
ncbi:MAG: metalloregulator ArsR/SmtB family transcription factor [Aerococcaceae bacterium]|nr:metalloregulator ArsR/SmtB family transcription factor [Aerococcaceae bacterium]